MHEPWYYDVVAPVYDIIVPRDVKGICDSLEEILKRHIKSKVIVDLGCGTGRFAIELAARTACSYVRVNSCSRQIHLLSY